MANVSKTEVVIKATDQFSGKVDRMQFSVEKFNASMSTFGKIGAALATSFSAFAGVDRLVSGFGSLISSGVKLNVMMENASVGMSGVLLNMTKVNDRQLKWNEAMAVSKGIITDLNKAAMVTAATPNELISTYSGLLGIGLGRGLSVEELKQFTVMGVNAVKSMGLDGRQLIQELRDLLQGSISAQKSTLATALGLSGADIKKAQNSADGLFKFLYNRMKGFETSAKYFPETFKGSIEVLKGSLELAFAEVSKPAMDTLKGYAQNMFKGIVDTSVMDKVVFNKDFIENLREVGDTVNEIIKSVKTAFDILQPIIKNGIEIIKVGLNAIGGNVDLIVSGFVAWKSFSAVVGSQTDSLQATIDRMSKSIGSMQSGMLGGQSLGLQKGVDFSKNILANVNLIASKYKGIEDVNKKITKNTSITTKAMLNNDIDFVQVNTEVGKIRSNLIALGEDKKKAVKATSGILQQAVKGNFGAAKEMIAEVNSSIAKDTAEMVGKNIKVNQLVSKGANENIARNLVSDLYNKNGGFGDKFNEDFTKISNSVDNSIARLEKFKATMIKFGAGDNQVTAMAEQMRLAYGYSFKDISEKASEIERTVKFNKWADGLKKYGMAAGSAALGIGTLATFMGEAFNSQSLKNIGDAAAKFGLVAIAVSQVADALRLIPDILKLINKHPLVAIASAISAIGIYAYQSYKSNEELVKSVEEYNQKAKEFNENAKNRGENIRKEIIDIKKFYEKPFNPTDEDSDNKSLVEKLQVTQFEGRLNDEGLKAAYSLALTNSKKIDEEMNKNIQLQAAYQKKQDELTQKAEEKEKKRLENLQKRWEDASVLEKDVIAKTTKITSTPFESAMATLDKEMEQLTERMNTAAIGLRQNGESESTISEFANRMKERIENLRVLKEEEIQIGYDLNIHWDKVFKNIKELSYNNTQTMIDGFNTLANEFVNFGQNIITEGGNFFDQFDDLLKNFANSIMNTMMKIYMQGLLTKSILAMFGGGGYDTSWLSGSSENASGTLSIGNYIVGHANGGVAKGWSLVGEKGAELVNFSNPGRVYTAQETAKAISGGGIGNVKVEVINNTGTQATATSDVKFDGENYIINVVMNAVNTNKGGMRNMLKGAMA